MASATLLALICFAAVVRSGAATDTTITANVYVTDSAGIDVKNVTSISAGQTFVLNFLLTDQASNATIGDLLGFCVVLRSQGPSQCQFTAQLASGTIQFAGLNYLPNEPSPNQYSPALFSITGGTGLYTGATGYYQEITPNFGSGPSTPGQSTNGVIITASYGGT